MSDSNLVGATFEKYEIQELVGKGGMATVYRGLQTSINRQVAVKVLPSALLHDGTFMERFKREAEVIASLEHFHILPVYDYGEWEGMPYIVMRYLEGGTVEDRIREGPLAWADIMRITGQIAQALDYAHARGVIHRDIKPSNILLDEAGNAYLADFGIAKVAEGTSNLTGSGIVGTPAYMAPEQSESGAPTPGMDVYALGCMIFEMLTGHVPYSADTPIAQILMHIQKPVPSVMEYYPDAPSELQEFLETAMAKNAGDRYVSCSELARALNLALMATGDDLNARPTLATTAAPTLAGPGMSPYQATRVGDGGSASARERIPAPAVQKRSGLPIGLIAAGGVIGLIIIAVVVGLIALSGKPDAEPTEVAGGVTGPTATEAVEATDAVQPTDAPTEETSDAGGETTEESTPEPVPTATPEVTVTPTPLPDSIFLRGVPMRLMPGGNFNMGKEGEGSYPRERPAHSVFLDTFYMDETEVTNVYYRACVDAGGCEYPEFTHMQIWDDYFTAERFDNYPVAWISWAEAQNYCRWRGGNLPTEAQWEKVARFNPTTGEQNTLFPWGENAADLFYANFGSEIGRPEETYQNPAGASPIGVQDLAGNMLEWVFDWYLDYFYEQSPRQNPLGPETGVEKVVRGGWWDSRGRELTTTWREPLWPGTKEDYVGFRCTYTPSGDPTLGFGEQPGDQ